MDRYTRENENQNFTTHWIMGTLGGIIIVVFGFIMNSLSTRLIDISGRVGHNENAIAGLRELVKPVEGLVKTIPDQQMKNTEKLSDLTVDIHKLTLAIEALENRHTGVIEKLIHIEKKLGERE